MNVSERVLRGLVPGLPAEVGEIAERLRAGGVGVERIVALRELLEPVVAARVEEVRQHPDADRLRICVVNDGTEQRLQIVTGAPNVEAGRSYPLFRSGVRLPDGTKIKRGKLRGEVSEGMLGSPDELELGSGHDGLMTLEGDPAPGTPLPQLLEIQGSVLVLEGSPDEDELRRALTGERPAE